MRQQLACTQAFRLRKAADDPTGVLAALRHLLDVRHEASPVLGLDRFAFARDGWKFNVLNVLPAWSLYCNGEHLHGADDCTRGLAAAS